MTKQERLKIIHFLNRPEVGGILNHVTNEFKMNLDGIDAKILFQENFGNHNKGIDLLQSNNITYEIIPNLGVSRGPIYYYRMYRWLVRFLRDENPDILVTHSPLPGYIGRLAAQKASVLRTVHIFHGHYFHSYFSKPITEILRRLERYLAKKTSRIVTISPEMKKALTCDYDITDPEHISVIPIHIDLLQYLDQNRDMEMRRKLGYSDDSTIFTSVGRLAPVKNQKLFIDVISRLKSEGKKVKAILVGKGESEKDLQEYLKNKKNLSMSIDAIDGMADFSFAGERTDISKILSISDVFVLTSLNEGTPLTIIEAQAAGLPVLSTDVGGVNGIVDTETTAMLSPSDDPDSMYQNALKIVDVDPAMKLQRKSEIAESYDLKKKRSLMQDFYAAIIEHPSHKDKPANS